MCTGMHIFIMMNGWFLARCLTPLVGLLPACRHRNTRGFRTPFHSPGDRENGYSSRPCNILLNQPLLFKERVAFSLYLIERLRNCI